MQSFDCELTWKALGLADFQKFLSNNVECEEVTSCLPNQKSELCTFCKSSQMYTHRNTHAHTLTHTHTYTHKHTKWYFLDDGRA